MAVIQADRPKKKTKKKHPPNTNPVHTNPQWKAQKAIKAMHAVAKMPPGKAPFLE